MNPPITNRGYLNYISKERGVKMIRKLLSFFLIIFFTLNFFTPVFAYAFPSPLPVVSLFPCEAKYTDYKSSEYSGYWLHEKGPNDSDTQFIVAAYLFYAIAMDAFYRDDSGVTFPVFFGDIESSLGYPRTKLVHGGSWEFIWLNDPTPAKPKLETYRALIYGQQIQYTNFLSFAKTNYYSKLVKIGNEIIQGLEPLKKAPESKWDSCIVTCGRDVEIYSMEFMPLFNKAFECLSQTPYISGAKNPDILSYYQRADGIKVKAVYKISEYASMWYASHHPELGNENNVFRAYTDDGSSWQYCFYRDLCCFEFIYNSIVPSSFCADMITVDYHPKLKSYIATSIVPGVGDDGGYKYDIDKSNNPNKDKKDDVGKDNSGLIAKIKSLFGVIKDKASQILIALKDGINPKLESIKKALNEVKEGIKNALSSPFSVITKKLDVITDKIKSFF
ncbi:hypothetical protein SAMN04489866_101227 [Peptococcus niger]|uniref:Uncharacterized protein n=2 Tax=Peptococcus niger TaxID=2741 RepID=A0A1G6S6X5_PEPNI|nr:hypothetical protein SAMN04489866_101227 [Peptococcus niger]